MGKFLLFVYLFLSTATTYASGPVCIDLFNYPELSPLVSSWVEKINRYAEQNKPEENTDLGPLAEFGLNPVKTSFLEQQKVHLEKMLKDGATNFGELAYMKPILVTNMDKPQEKYKLVALSEKTYLFSLDGLTPPKVLQAKTLPGFIVDAPITKLESNAFYITATADGLNIYPKQTTTLQASLTIEADGSYTLRRQESQASQYQSNLNSFLNLALQKTFSNQLSAIQKDHSISEYQLGDIKIARSLYSEENFAILPTNNGKDYITLSLKDGSVSLLTRLSSDVHGRVFVTESGESIKVTSGVGFLAQPSIETAFNSNLSDAIFVIQNKARFILERDLTSDELKLLDISIHFAINKGLDMSNPAHLESFLQGYNQLEAHVLANIGIQAVNELQATYQDYKSEAESHKN
ncbi:MAG: hypothetical protein KDD37_11045 [Bdellovibrionales bacterium]|nr:hypothetical protein [Bdellovibrionales bacterium]